MVGIGAERLLGAGGKDTSSLDGHPVQSGPADTGVNNCNSLYQIVVQCTERSNRAIPKLNEFRRQRCCNPTYSGVVSEDETEEPMLMNPNLPSGGPPHGGASRPSIAMGLGMDGMHEPPSPDLVSSTENPAMEGPQTTADQWKEVVARVLSEEGGPTDLLLLFYFILFL